MPAMTRCGIRSGRRLGCELSTILDVTNGASWASTAGTRRSMQSNVGSGNQLELRLRRRLHAAGLRYRVDYRPVKNLRRTADIAFPRLRLAVFVDGCFWHQCPSHASMPKTNRDFWRAKLNRNVERDRETNEMLLAAGWSVLRIWEHEDPDTAVARVIDAVATLKGAAT